MPAAGLVNPAHVVGARRWLLLFSLATVFFILLALYCGVLSVLLPNQMQALDPANKERNLAILFAITTVFSTTITPIAGALSDRTRTRFGRRTPWIVAGSLIGGTSLMISSQMHTLWTIIFFWVLAGASLNSMQSALTTIVADRFPERERGTVSGFVGAGMTAGGTIGIVLAGYTASSLTLAYALFAVPIALVCVSFVLLNPETRIPRNAPPPWRTGQFFKS